MSFTESDIENMSNEDFTAFMKTFEKQEESPDVEEPTTDENIPQNEEEEEASNAESSTDEGSDTSAGNTEEEDNSEELDEVPYTENDLLIQQIFSKPFVAAGKELQVKSEKEAITLMQKGAGYNDLARKSKPAKILKRTLDDNNITADDLNLLIDAHKGNKGAIRKLIDKNNIDTLDLEDVEKGSYSPNENIISDSVYDNLDKISQVKNGEFGERINNVILHEWDTESKNFALQNIDILPFLEEEMRSGNFDKLQSIITREKTFSNYNTSKPDLQRYLELVELQRNGERKVPTKKPVQQSKQSASPTPSNVSSKSSGTKKTIRDFTDAQIEKMSEKDFKKIMSQS